MVQDYDKIFREVLKEVFPAVAQKVLGIPEGDYQPLPVDLQYTSERGADQVWEVTLPGGDPFVLHCEFQTGNDKQMLPRMLLYHALLYCQQKKPVQQYVVYVGKEPAQMARHLQSGGLSFHYGLIDLKSFPYQSFLASGRSAEVLFAILGDFGGEPEALVAEKIIAKLGELAKGELELGQRTLQLVRLAVLRNLGTTVLNAAQKMALNIDIKEDALYVLGQEAGEQKGLEKGLQKGLEKRKEEGKEETALDMLREDFAEEVVARITKLPAARIAQLRQQLEAGQ